MNMTWGYVWGIWWWRNTGENMNPAQQRTGLCNIPTPTLSAELFRSSDMTALRDRGLASGIPQSVPTDVVVIGMRPNVHNSRFLAHQWNGFVPIGSICATRDNNYVCSPEFCLLQVGRYLKRLTSTSLEPWQYVVILTELVCEFCGTYSKQNTTRGFKNRRNPLTTLGQIMMFCGRMAFEPGANTLRKAASWIVEGLNSPMETILYLLFCLPKSYGGLEFPRPFSNYPIPVPAELRTKARKGYIVPDLFWPEANLIVEFNGKDTHEGQEVEDQERQEVAQEMGYAEVTFRKADLYDSKRFMSKAQSVAKYLGHALPPSSERFDELQNTLRTMLLRHERWI